MRACVALMRARRVLPQTAGGLAGPLATVWALATALALAAAPAARAETVGEVSTAFKLIGANHKIVVEAYDDPKVKGVACYVSRAKTGGLAGTFGLAEDKAEASIACRQVGPVSFVGEPLKPQEEVFSERQSLLFKKLTVVRMVDTARNTLVYLTYSDRVIEGSPQNSVTAVPLAPGVVIPLKSAHGRP
jgi:CreA protein